MSDAENVELDEGSGQIGGDAEMELEDLADRRRSSRRRESSRQQQRKSGLEKLREARQSGRGYRPNVSIGDDRHKDEWESEFPRYRYIQKQHAGFPFLDLLDKNARN